MEISSFVKHLERGLDELVTLVRRLVSRSTVVYEPTSYDSFIPVYRPDFQWAESTDDVSILQMEARSALSKWAVRFCLIQKLGTPELRRSSTAALAELDKGWINRTDWLLGLKSIKLEDADRLLTETVAPIYDFLRLFPADSSHVLFVIDTNALCLHTDPRDFGRSLELKKYTIVIPPTVLAELDELKVRARNPEFRAKAQKASRRIKGWRTQGNILEGVKIHGSITARLQAWEPRMDETLPQLDASNMDDRILASALELQVDAPTATVAIVTNDINLQTKCLACGLSFVEPQAAAEEKV